MRFLESQFRNLITLYFYTGAVMVVIGVIILLITLNIQIFSRIFYNCLLTLTCYVFMNKNHKSSQQLNLSILLVYIAAQIFYFENLMNQYSLNNRILGFSILSHI